MRLFLAEIAHGSQSRPNQKSNAEYTLDAAEEASSEDCNTDLGSPLGQSSNEHAQPSASELKGMPLARSVPIAEDNIAAVDATASPVHDLLPVYRVRVSTDSQPSIDDELKGLDNR